MKHLNAFADIQEGNAKAKEPEHQGFHIWFQVDMWDDSNGHSRRLHYGLCKTWEEAKATQLRFSGLENKNVGTDIGGGKLFRENIKRTHDMGWYGYKGDDALGFVHRVPQGIGKPDKMIDLPWSPYILYSPLSGQKVDKRIRNSKLAHVMNWSNPSIYPILYALKNGEGRYYGIASDMPQEYLSQINSHMPDGKGGWMKTNPDDHAWDTSCGCLLIAMRRNWFRIE